MTKALLLPSDTPPTEASLKRQLLFFDAVAVPSYRDAAIVNRQEISEVYPDGRSITCDAYCPYPRATFYEDQFRLIQSRAERATRNGELRFVDLPASSPEHALQTWFAAVAALKTEALVMAALPDYAPADPPVVPFSSNAGYMMVVPSYTGGPPSKFAWTGEVDTASAGPPMDELWRRTAMGRLGRALKVVHRASVTGAIPLAADAMNQRICLALGAKAFADVPTPAQMAAAAVSMDAVDPVTLHAALESMSWEEVFRVRKEILPAVKKLQKQVADSVAIAGRSQNADLSAYLDALSKLRTKHEKARDQVSEAWQKLGFGTLVVAAGETVAGLASVATNGAWSKELTIVAIGLAAKALGTVTEQAQAIVRGREQRNASPLFAFDGLVAGGEAQLNRGPKDP